MKQEFSLDGNLREATKFLHSKDSTGGILATVMFMDTVEDWVLSRLEGESAELREEVRSRMLRLSEIVQQFRQHIAPDNHAMLQLLSWLRSTEYFYTLDYLTQFQPEFTAQFFQYCTDNADSDVNANLCRERIKALYKVRLLDRVFSEDSLDYLMAIFKDEKQ
jgi:hypothetical protein